MLPSSRLSSTPVTVTVCGVLQLAEVKVNDAGETVPSVVSLELRPIVTLAVGFDVSTTVNVAVPPASVVLPLIAETVIPGVGMVTTNQPTSPVATPAPVVARVSRRLVAEVNDCANQP